MKSELIELYKYDPFKNGQKIMAHHKYVPDMRATFAMDVLIRLALVAAEADGEDSAGRAKLRRSSPDELSSFACDLAESVFKEFEKREWLAENIPYEETP